MTVVYQSMIVRADLHANREVLYLFGDNEQRKGLGGLAAECRGEPNACGIRTKKRPKWDDDAMWSDADFDRVRPLIDADFEKAFRWVVTGRVVVAPREGIGQYRARLPEVAPRIDAYIKAQIVRLAQI